MSLTKKISPIRIAIVVLALFCVGVLVAHRLSIPDHASRLYDSPPEGAQMVLFVGNSHTTYNHMLPLLERIADADQRHPPLWIVAETHGGRRLFEHSHAGVAQAKMDALRRGHVVLQGASLEPIIIPDYYAEHVQYLADFAKERGMQPILYPTWTRQAGERTYAMNDTPDDVDQAFELLDKITADAAGEAGIPRAPTHSAFELVRQHHPSINLYEADGNHANDVGVYLAALVLYGVLIDDDLPAAPWVPDTVPEDLAQPLRDIAAQALAASY